MVKLLQQHHLRAHFKLRLGTWVDNNHAMEYLRIFPATLDQGKRWYMIKSPFCKPSKFSQRVIFNYFPEEITKTPASQLTTEDGRNLLSVGWFHKNQKATPDVEVYTITSFDIYTSLFMQKNGLETLKGLDYFRFMLNSFSLDDIRAKSLKMRAKSPGIIYNDPLLSNLAKCLTEQIDQRDKQTAKLTRDLDVFEQQIKSLEVHLHDEFGMHRSKMKQVPNTFSGSWTTSPKSIARAWLPFWAILSAKTIYCEVRDLLGEIADLVAKEKGKRGCKGYHVRRDLQTLDAIDDRPRLGSFVF